LNWSNFQQFTNYKAIVFFILDFAVNDFKIIYWYFCL